MREKMRKPLPIGVSDFDKIIRDDYYYIDKTLLIKELLENKGVATLIPRPRRFGKTLNLSMLRCFFEKNADSKRYLFDGLKITQYPEIMAEQGQYPVICLTFKEVESMDWESSLKKIKEIIGNEFRRHSYLLDSSTLDGTEQDTFRAIISEKADETTYETSLKRLTRHLAAYHQKQVIVLVDEYDAPIHAGYRHKYYDHITLFIRNFLSGGLKDNSDLQYGVVTGIMRIAKEGFFSGLNNLAIYTMVDNLYADKFGLLEDEVYQLLSAYELSAKIDEVRTWYNGYRSAKYTVYNPWSIVNLVNYAGEFKLYWVNASNNEIIKKLIKSGGMSVKRDAETLMQGDKLNKPLQEHIVYHDLGRNDATLWNYLFAAGYLTYRGKEGRSIDLVIPNKEILNFFEETVLSWFTEDDQKYSDMLDGLVAGDIETFKKLFSQFVLVAFSSFDVSGKNPENFYHAFVLGILASLAEHYEVRSNRESGYGRYDVTITPKNVSKVGIIIEFKKVDEDEKETLEQAVTRALQQIEDKGYETEMRARGISQIRKVAIAFERKKALVGWC